MDASTGSDTFSVAEGEVREALTRILDYPDFARSPRGSAFLQYVVEETLAKRETYLKAYTIALAVFEKPDDFDPQTDPLVRVHAVRLRRMLESYYRTAGQAESVIIALPKGSYTPRFLARDSTNSGSSATFESVSGIPRVAVMPFDNLGDDETLDFFAAALSEEIAAQLTCFREIAVVTGRAPPARDSAARADFAGRELGANYYLDGTFFRAGSRLRVTAQLSDTFDGRRIWSDRYDRNYTADDIFEIQDSISARIVGEIADLSGAIYQTRIARARGKAPANMDAFEFYLRAVQYYRTGSPGDWKWAKEGLEQAVALDPNYAPALSTLAVMEVDTIFFGNKSGESAATVLRRAMSLAKHATRLEPGSAVAHHSLFYVLWGAGDLNGAHKAAQRALDCNPNYSLILGDYGMFLAIRGEWEASIEHVEKAMGLNANYFSYLHFPMALFHFCTGNYPDAHAEAAKCDYPEICWAYAFQAIVAAAAGDTGSARRSVDALNALDPTYLSRIDDELAKLKFAPTVREHLIDGAARLAR